MNPLKDLPPEIGQLSNLRSLFLKGSHIGVLPIELLSLKELKQVQCHGSPLFPMKNFVAVGKSRTKKIALLTGQKMPFQG